MTPAWILDVFAAVMLLVAAVSAARLVAARPWQRGAVVTDTDISHLLMGIAMAGVLAPGLPSLPSGPWVAVFGLLTAWFGYRAARDCQANGAQALAAGQYAPQLVHCAAMAYMFDAIKAPAPAVASGTAGMEGMPALGAPTLALAFAVVLAGYVVWDLDQISGLRGSAAAAVVAAVPGEAYPGQAQTAGGRGLTAVLSSTGTVVGCRVALGVTMALMVLLKI